jgi:hypothetical protein
MTTGNGYSGFLLSPPVGPWNYPVTQPFFPNVSSSPLRWREEKVGNIIRWSGAVNYTGSSNANPGGQLISNDPNNPKPPNGVYLMCSVYESSGSYTPATIFFAPGDGSLQIITLSLGAAVGAITPGCEIYFDGLAYSLS